MRERTGAAATALAFLTVIPIGRAAPGGHELRRAAVWFPVVGGAIGALEAAVASTAALALPPLPSALLAVAVGVGITGALHVDGLGDVADGVGAALSGGDPVPAMRDPHLGTFGVVAVALDLVLKASLVAALAARGFAWPLVGAAALARVAPIVLAWRLSYVGGGTGGWTARIGARAGVASVCVGVALAAATAGLAAAGMVVAVAGVALAIGAWSRRRLGGITGDGFGAAAELGETLALVAAVAVR
jgi:adenosylcobinamide-GDP ribazoletransferase